MKFEPCLSSLYRYQTPDWFRDAEFGVLTCKLPEKLPTEYTNCLKITLA